MGNVVNLNPILNVLDSEVLEIGRVLAKVNEKTGQPVHMESFRKEIIERFAQIGFVADVVVFSGMDAGGLPLEGVYPLDIEIVGRCEPLKDGFDYDRMKSEVVNNILDLPGQEKGKTLPFNPDLLHQDKPHKH